MKGMGHCHRPATAASKQLSLAASEQTDKLLPGCDISFTFLLMLPMLEALWKA
jgi:hypothetical protein